MFHDIFGSNVNLTNELKEKHMRLAQARKSIAGVELTEMLYNNKAYLNGENTEYLDHLDDKSKEELRRDLRLKNLFEVKELIQSILDERP